MGFEKLMFAFADQPELLHAINRDLLMVGHFDKLTMTRGEAAMRAEFERLRPLMEAGGFIPSVDHQTPPGVSLGQYWCFLGLLKEYTQGS